MTSKPVINELLQLRIIENGNVVYMSVFLPIQNTGLRDSFVTHSFWIRLMGSATRLIFV